MEIIIQQPQGSTQSNIFKLKMGARDSSFINKVSCLAKWLIQSITTFIISKSCIHSVFRDSCKNRYSMLFILSQLRFTQLTGLWLMITFTIYLSNKLTFSLMSLNHVLSLLITAYSFKARDLIIAIHSIHAIDQFQIHSQTQKF